MHRCPPGPRGIPWLGQALDIPLFHSHLYYTGLKDLYAGDIVGLTVCGQKLIVLNSYAAAFDILGKHGAKHGNRPENPFCTHFLGLEHHIPLLNATDEWKEARRVYQTLLSKAVVRRDYAGHIATQCCRSILHRIEKGGDGDCQM
ncbi:cytochrome P450 [Clavulina sp. PMI_390]|nr:cytochrome P450 [Clavulina sp. PMI_390]